MSDLNKVMIIGRLGKDQEMRYTASGSAVANVTIATGDKWKDKQTGEPREQTEWHRVVFFQGLGEIAGEYLKKGSQVFVEGKLQTRKWTDKEGQDRYTTEIVADNMQMLGSRGEAKPEQHQGFRDKPTPPAQQKSEDDFQDDDIPF